MFRAFRVLVAAVALALGFVGSVNAAAPRLIMVSGEPLAEQIGRFYPAVDGKPALVDVPGYGRWPKVANDTALRIRDVQGVPVQLGENDRRRVLWVVVGVFGGASVVLALLFAARRFRRIRSSGAVES